MGDLLDHAKRVKYNSMKINDPLIFIENAIDWDAFTTLLNDLYHNDTDNGGRPGYKTSVKNGGKYIDPKRVLELKAKGMSARSTSKFMGCSITPVLKIINGE